MTALKQTGTVKTITTHYMDGAFVPSHGREVMDIIRPTDAQLIAQVTLGDEEDTRRAIAAAKRAFASYGTSKPEERAEILRRLHKAASARLDDLTAAMVEEYGGIVQFAGPIVQSGVNAFLAAEKALREMPWTRSWDKTTVTLEPVGVAGLITAWNANALFICLKLPLDATDNRRPLVWVRFHLCVLVLANHAACIGLSTAARTPSVAAARACAPAPV
jgi:aldehyde dehydrogenase (NAD+)